MSEEFRDIYYQFDKYNDLDILSDTINKFVQNYPTDLIDNDFKQKFKKNYEQSLFVYKVEQILKESIKKPKFKKNVKKKIVKTDIKSDSE